ncbi:MAG: radical SAM protein [Desulfobulbales bacterium]|nr:radical SAM protein [Desulfobulbales bacterium]
MGRSTKTAVPVTANREYLLLEKGSIKKKWKNRLPIALIYPHRYTIGMSNLGYQVVYQLLNQNDAIVAERFFLPESGGKPLSLESNRPLADFPLLFFSVSFEQDYEHVIMLLAMSNIAALASERTHQSQDISAPAAGGQPLVVAGGVATFMNPEPLAPFVDLFLIGEAEPLLPSLINYLLKGSSGKSKIELLAAIGANLPGCYIPAFYEPAYDSDGLLLASTPRDDAAGLPERIKKVLMDSPGNTTPHSSILTPMAEFSNLYMAELGRGCSRGCRFCAAGFIYRPPRLWPARAIINAIDSRPDESSRVGLLGMEMIPAKDMTLIADYLSRQSCSLSFSSLRADIINNSLLELLGSSNLKSVAIAPDGASERLRLVINKGITESDILTAAETFAKKGIRNLKLYFMVGLPTESQPDLDEMVELVMKVKNKILAVGRAKGRLTTLTLSINCFIPKPWTPFQFHPMADIGSLRKKLKFLRKKLAPEPNIRIKTENPEKAFFQAVLARGDRRVGRVILTRVHSNCTWRQAFKKENINPADYTLRPRGATEYFPWEIIDHAITRKFLWREYQKALEGKTTIPCDTSRCKRCGVC